jgi:hypothetical protein
MNKKNIKPVIVAIAKKEQPYIEEWVRWHIALGFDHIYLYDNEDTPTYENLLRRYSEFVSVMYLPGNNYIFYNYKFHHNKAVQYVALEDFVINKHIVNNNNTHAIHIDLDEFIVLKKHNNIKDFINDFFIDDCGAIGINWRFFGEGDSISKEDSSTTKPVVLRFTKRQKGGDNHIKTLFNISHFESFNTVHDVNLKTPYKIKNTKKDILNGAFNTKHDFDYIQINHYKTKSYEEFSKRIDRLRADLPMYSQSAITNRDIIQSMFDNYNHNEEIDLYAHNYLNNVEAFWCNYFNIQKLK